MRKRNKLLLLGAATMVLAAGGVKVFQREIGLAVFERAVSQRVGRDTLAGLPDGLHIGLCGTGSPLPSRDRAGACTVVIAGRQMLVVDAGEGGARNMQLMGLPMAQTRALFLTHFHSDHIDGLGPLMLLRWAGSNNTAPLPIYGATGVEAVVAGFSMAYAADNGYRTAHHGPGIALPAAAGGTAIPFAIGPEHAKAPLLVYEQDGLRVTAFPVDHDPVRPAIGYRFDYKGRSAVISGDTAASPALNAAAKGADLLVHEALQPALVSRMTQGLDSKGLAKTAQITRDILDYHASPEVAADAARVAGVKHLVLSHIVPPVPGRFFHSAFLGDAHTRFSGPITVGEDGMMFSLPAGRADIDRTQLF